MFSIHRKRQENKAGCKVARKIQPELFKLIDEKLKNNGAAQVAISSKNARSLLVFAAEACVGQKESGGNNNGAFVELCQKTVDGFAGSEAWCMAFVQSMIAYVEKKLNVVSPLFSSEHCLTTWTKTDQKQRVINFPAMGAIVIWRHGDTQSGHTGFFIESENAKDMETVEGNTGASSFRDGDGVFVRNRSMKKNGTMKVVGFLKPF